MGCSAHVFLATRDDDLAVAPSHRLGGQHHGFEARAAYRIDGETWHLFGNAALHQRLASGVLPSTRGEHLTHDDLAHQSGIHTRAGHHIFDDQAAEFGGAEFGQAAAKFAHGGTGG